MSRESLGWWGENWLQWLRSLRVGPASDGQLRSAQRAEGEVEVKKGRLSARVWVGDRRLVTALIQVRPWTERHWRQAIKAIAARSAVAQQLLSGSFGSDLAKVLADEQISLFPENLSVGCSCGNRSDSCRHLNFLALQMADRLEENPFLWLEVLGRPRTQLLAEVKAALADQTGSSNGGAGESPSAPIQIDRFWDGAPDLGPVDGGATWRLAADLEPVADADQLIRSLGPLPFEEHLYLLPSRSPIPPAEWLRRMVVQIGAGAAALLEGEPEDEPIPVVDRPASLPGKGVNLAYRLAHEVTAVIRSREEMLQLEALAVACPTVRAVGSEEQALRAMREACLYLPADLVHVANHYVGTSRALLRGASFCHVVTFDEWAEQRASSDADWARALDLAGREIPTLATDFARLQPSVGDELWISPGEGAVQLRLVRRGERDPGAQLAADGTAAQLLQILIGQLQVGGLSEQEAVGALLAEGGYRDGLHPDPIWLLPLLGLGLYHEPGSRLVTRFATGWRPTPPRFIYSNWRQDQAVQAFQARVMKRWETREQIELATLVVKRWCQAWPGAQDQPSGADSLGSFLQFLWNEAPRVPAWQRGNLEQIPLILDEWFASLEERNPALTGLYTKHRKACGLLEHWVDRCKTAPPAGRQAAEALPWLAEGLRWIGPTHYLKHGSYN